MVTKGQTKVPLQSGPFGVAVWPVVPRFVSALRYSLLQHYASIRATVFIGGCLGLCDLRLLQLPVTPSQRYSSPIVSRSAAKGGVSIK